MPDVNRSAVSPDMPCTPANDVLHDILNNNQVAIGYLELAMEQINPENELRYMLDHVHKALRRSSDLAITAYRVSRTTPVACEPSMPAEYRNP